MELSSSSDALGIPTAFSERVSRPMDRPFFQKVAQALANTEPDEIACDECFEELDRFAELARAGKPVEEIMPKVKGHLERCRDCREEYEALLAALREIEG